MEGITRTTAMITDPTAVVERLLVHGIPRATVKDQRLSTLKDAWCITTQGFTKNLGGNPYNYAGVPIFTIDVGLGVPIST